MIAWLRKPTSIEMPVWLYIILVFWALVVLANLTVDIARWVF